MILIDTHAHLHDRRFAADQEEVLARAMAADVQGIITVGTDLESSKKAIALASRHSGNAVEPRGPVVYATVGVHPHDASKLNPEMLAELERLASEKAVVAIGEIGLDLYRNLSPPAVQEKVFVEQLELARRLDKPVVIHDRDAHTRVLSLLRQVGKDWQGVLHCFSGDEEMARQAMSMGFLISLAGPLTFENAHRPQAVARLVPLERLLIETDCPYLAPEPYRGKRNEPAYVRQVAVRLAELKNTGLEHVAQVTTENAVRLFRLPPLG